MIHSFWSGIFWPYFQFGIFVVAIVYFARKPVSEFLASKRDELRTKLSEAREALTLAERQIKHYEAQMLSLQQHIEKIEKQFKEKTEAEHNSILAEANSNADAILKEAKRASLELISQTQIELKNEMYKLVLEEFNKKLTPDRIKMLEDQFCEETINTIPVALKSVNSTKNSSLR